MEERKSTDTIVIHCSATPSSMDIEYIFDQTYTDNVKEIGVIQGTLSSLIFGTAENAFKPNPREQ